MCFMQISYNNISTESTPEIHCYCYYISAIPIYYIKLKSHLSVHISSEFLCHIDLGCGCTDRHQTCLKWKQRLLASASLFWKVSNHFSLPSTALGMCKCRGFCWKLCLHSCKTAAQTWLIIYTKYFQHDFIIRLSCVGSTHASHPNCCGFKSRMVPFFNLICQFFGFRFM